MRIREPSWYTPLTPSRKAVERGELRWALLLTLPLVLLFLALWVVL